MPLKYWNAVGMIMFLAVLSYSHISVSQQNKTPKSTVKTQSKFSINGKILKSTAYKKLSRDEKRLYILSIRNAWLEFERSQNKKTKFANSDLNPIWNYSIRFAHANRIMDTSKQCVIGGMVRFMDQDINGNWKCPTYGRSCTGDGVSDEGFTCGKIYSSICVDRNPIDKLSSRCHEAIGDKVPSVEEYGKIRDIVLDLQQRFCAEAAENSPCSFFNSRIAKIHQELKLDQPNLVSAAPTIAEAATPANGPADDSSDPARADAGAMRASASAPVASAPASTTRIGGSANVEVTINVPPSPAGLGRTLEQVFGRGSETERVPAPTATVNDPVSCKAAHGLVIEGATGQKVPADSSGATGTEVNLHTHNQASAIAQAMAAYATQLEITPPNGHIKYIAGENDETLSRIVRGLKTANTCSSEVSLATSLFAGNGTLVSRVGAGNKSTDNWFNSQSFNSYGQMHLKNAVSLRNQKSFDAKSSRKTVRQFDYSSEKMNENSPIIKALDKAQKQCGAETDQVVMVSLVGSNTNFDGKCGITTGDGKFINAKSAYENIIKPLRQKGAKVVFQSMGAGSSCLNKEIAKLSKEDKDLASKEDLCLMASTDAKVRSMTSYGILNDTYDANYSHFLNAYKNPLAAHICSTLMDGYSESSISSGAGSSGSSIQTQDLSSKSAACTTALNNELKGSFPNGRPGVTRVELAKISNCPQLSEYIKDPTKNNDLSLAEDSSIFDFQSEPKGVRAVQRFLSNEDDAASATRACNINLAEYAPNATRQASRQIASQVAGSGGGAVVPPAQARPAPVEPATAIGEDGDLPPAGNFD